MAPHTAPPSMGPPQGCLLVLTTWQLVHPEHVVLERARRKLKASYDLTQKPLTSPQNPVVDTVLLRCNGTTRGHRCQEVESIVAILETSSYRQGQQPRCLLPDSNPGVCNPYPKLHLTRKSSVCTSRPDSAPWKPFSVSNARACSGKVICSQFAKAPFVRKLLPARFAFCFNQVKRCDPDAPSSLGSLSWRCKRNQGKGGDSYPPLCQFPGCSSWKDFLWERQRVGSE